MVTMSAAKSVTATFTDLPPTAMIIVRDGEQVEQGRDDQVHRQRSGEQHDLLTFTCKLDGKPFESCTSPTVYKNLKKGKHTVQVEASTRRATSPRPP